MFESKGTLNRFDDLPLSLYVHLPWCVRKCPYCDFNSHALHGEIPEGAYVDALLRDLDFELRSLAMRPLVSVFIGGGTPSLFGHHAIARLLDGIGQRLGGVADAEITLEANPGSADAGRFRKYRDAGINRISLGVQSFDDASLARLGRVHDGAEARQAVAAARRAGFDNINLDLMYGLPGQSVADAVADVGIAVDLAPSHLSVYQLTLEPGTPFHRRPPSLPDHDTLWDMHTALEAKLAAGGYARYEVSAYARPGRRCAHNENYWAFGDYLGIGAGAHAKLSGPGGVRRTRKVRSPRAFMHSAGMPACLAGARTLTRGELGFEFLLNALRLTEGFAIATFHERTGLTPAAIEAPLQRACERGWLCRDEHRIRPTATGYRFLDDVLQLFLPPPP